MTGRALCDSSVKFKAYIFTYTLLNIHIIFFIDYIASREYTYANIVLE